VASGIITAVEMLSFKLWRLENGTVRDVEEMMDNAGMKRKGGEKGQNPNHGTGG
jgi:hypothetical protein